MNKEIMKTINSVEISKIIEKTASQGVAVSSEIQLKLRKMLEEELSTANFDLVDDLNQKFSKFIDYEGAKTRLEVLLGQADKMDIGKDIEKMLNDVIEDLNESSKVMSGETIARNAGGLISMLMKLFSVSPQNLSEAFKQGLNGLSGQIEQIQGVIEQEQKKSQLGINLLKQYLPEIAEDVIKMEYLDKILDQILEKNQLSKEAENFLISYRSSIISMKQVISASLTRTIIRKGRTVKSKLRLDQIENKLVSSMGAQVLESLLNSIEETNNHVYNIIDKAIDTIEENNEKKDLQNRENELQMKRKYLEVMKGFGAKLEKIKTDYISYKKENDKISKETKDYFEVYEGVYEKHKELRNKLLTSGEEQKKLMKEISANKMFNKEELLKEKLKVEEELKAEVI